MRACRGHKSSVHFHWDHHLIFKMYIFVVKVTGNSAGMIICLQSPVNDGSSLNNWFLSKITKRCGLMDGKEGLCVLVGTNVVLTVLSQLNNKVSGPGHLTSGAWSRGGEDWGDTHQDTDMVTESALGFGGLVGCFTLSYHWYDNDVHHFRDSTKQ